MSKNKFPLEKILSVGLRDYCISVNKNIGDYELFGVQSIFREFNHHKGKFNSIVDLFQSEIPKDAEAVINYRLTGSIYHDGRHITIAYGVALIPKEK